MKTIGKRTIVLFLVLIMALGMLPAVLTASAATAPKEGMTFSSEAFYQLTNKLNVPNSITFETTLWIPCDAKDTDRNGVVIGNYSDDPAYGGSVNTYGLEMYTNGNVRLFTHAYSYIFTEVDIRDYVGTSSAPEFVDIAVTADTAAHTATLYVNGVAMQTITNSRIKPGLFNSAELSLCLGTDRRIGNSRYFNGKIKDIAVYGDVRTAEEIAAASAEGYTLDVADTNLLVAFDLTSETPFTDLSANKNNALYYPLGGASFAASDAKQYLETKLTEKVRTYTAKIYCPTNISRTGVILGNYQNKNGEQPCLNFEIHSNGTPSLYIKDTNGVAKPKFNGSDANGNRLSDVRRNGWVHLVIVDTGSEFRCYIDGVFTEAVSYTAANVKAGYTYDIAKVQSVNQLSVGRDTRDNLVFTGKIDHIAYFSEALTDSEIADLYKNGVDTDEESLMLYYDLKDGNNGPVIEDKSDNKNNASPLYYERGYNKTDYAYSIAVVGDTQKQVWRDFLTANDSDPSNDTHYTDAIYQWLVDNKDSKNIQYVFGVGDITENNGNPSKNSSDLEWEIAKNAITKLDAAGMAYSVILGNHDTAAQFNKFFADPSDDFYTSRIDGYYVEGDLSNYYVKFEINGIKYLHIGLEYGPRDAVLAWAGQVADDNPDRIVIVTTHAYMFRDGTTLDKGDVVPPNSSGVITSASSRNNGDMMWEKFASQHRNILLVLSGHDPYENIAFRQDKGIYGNTVSQFLVDPQGMAVDLGMVCMLYFDEDGRQVDVEWISTAKTQAAQKNDPTATDILYKSFNQFDFEMYTYAGNGIYKTELVSRVGNIDTYRIYYTNGTYDEYTVENGLSLTVTDIKKETNGLIDIYTIYFSDGSTTTYTVKNGEDGKDGADGKTPYIGENGNWWIGTVDTGVKASGATAEPDYGNRIVGGVCGGSAEWYVTDKNILVIEGNGSMNNYSVGKTPWADYATTVEKIVVKNGITTVGKTAFYGFTALKSVELPSSLVAIEDYAFFGCAKLGSITIPANTRLIGAYAFRKSGLTSFVLRNPEAWSIKGIETPENMDLAGVAAAYIRNEYYTTDWYVSDVAVGDVITSGFCGKNVIWTLTTDGTLTIKGSGAMNGYGSTTMPWYGYINSIFNIVIEGDITNIGAYSFVNASNVQTVTMPQSIESIGKYAFYGNESLTEIIIPATVKEIGMMAFGKCPLNAVYFGNGEGWVVNGAAIIAEQLLDPLKAAECVALNVKYEWKVEDEDGEDA